MDWLWKQRKRLRQRALGLGQRGGLALELAVLTPLMVMMFFGCIEVTLLARAHVALDNAAQTIADVVARETSARSVATIADACSAGGLVMAPIGGAGTLKAAVVSVTNNTETGTISEDWQDVSCGTATALLNGVTLGTPYVPSSGDTVLVVQVTYSYHALISLVLPAQFTLTGSAYTRPRGTS